MKLALALLLSALSTTAFARSTDTSPILDGSAVVYPEVDNRLTLTVTGRAADAIMNSINNGLMSTIDPAPGVKTRILMKDGKDISCTRTMGLNDTSCTIKLGNVYSGEIGK